MHKDFIKTERHPRFFKRGDIKYVILDLLKDNPSHGYEIIRTMDDRFHGLYSPSAGNVYPTLQHLEDLGYVTSTESEGKKTFTITESGKQFLAENEEIMHKIRGYSMHWEKMGNTDDFQRIRQELKDIFQLLSRNRERLNPEKLAAIRNIISNSTREINNAIESNKQDNS
jgi:DNA-binding PadR family transcriptional regulator